MLYPMCNNGCKSESIMKASLPIQIVTYQAGTQIADWTCF